LNKTVGTQKETSGALILTKREREKKKTRYQASSTEGACGRLCNPQPAADAALSELPDGEVELAEVGEEGQQFLLGLPRIGGGGRREQVVVRPRADKQAGATGGTRLDERLSRRPGRKAGSAFVRSTVSP
jgi:hypothetical protein